MESEELAELRRKHDEAKAVVNALSNQDALRAANVAYRAAYDALNKAERKQWGKEIVARLVGQTIAAVRMRGAFPDRLPEGMDDERLDECAQIVLSNGVLIDFYGDEGGGELTVSFPRESATAVDAVDPVLARSHEPSTRDESSSSSDEGAPPGPASAREVT